MTSAWITVAVLGLAARACGSRHTLWLIRYPESGSANNSAARKP